MQVIQSGPVALNVRVDGPETGPVMMFANSLGTDLRVWDPIMPLLPKDVRVVRFDKRGHGLSDCPDAPYDMQTLVKDAEAVADALNVKDCLFVGLSIGGLIGQGLAAARPDLVKALVLMDTAAKIGTAEMWNERIDGLQKTGLAPMAEGILDRWFTAPLRQDTANLAPWKNMLQRTPLQGYMGCCAAIATADYTASTAALSIPVMAMVGSDDGATPPELVRATAELCNAAFHLVEGAGHLPCVEKPAETAQLINTFFEETRNG